MYLYECVLLSYHVSLTVWLHVAFPSCLKSLTQLAFGVVWLCLLNFLFLLFLCLLSSLGALKALTPALVPFIAYGSQSGSLGDAATFPFFLRTCHASTMTTNSLIEFLFFFSPFSIESASLVL
jgi:hypothetical protein